MNIKPLLLASALAAGLLSCSDDLQMPVPPSQAAEGSSTSPATDVVWCQVGNLCKAFSVADCAAFVTQGVGTVVATCETSTPSNSSSGAAVLPPSAPSSSSVAPVLPGEVSSASSVLPSSSSAVAADGQVNCLIEGGICMSVTAAACLAAGGEERKTCPAPLIPWSDLSGGLVWDSSMGGTVVTGGHWYGAGDDCVTPNATTEETFTEVKGAFTFNSSGICEDSWGLVGFFWWNGGSYDISSSEGIRIYYLASGDGSFQGKLVNDDLAETNNFAHSLPKGDYTTDGYEMPWADFAQGRGWGKTTTITAVKAAASQFIFQWNPSGSFAVLTVKKVELF